MKNQLAILAALLVFAGENVGAASKAEFYDSLAHGGCTAVVLEDMRAKAAALEFGTTESERVLALVACRYALARDRENYEAVTATLGTLFPGSVYLYEMRAGNFRIPCAACEGTGDAYTPCPVCNGSGICRWCSGRGYTSTQVSPYSVRKERCIKCGGSGACYKCMGKGGIPSACPACGGSGAVVSPQLRDRFFSDYLLKLLRGGGG